jgi:predicted RNase H-like HicB family nuclease
VRYTVVVIPDEEDGGFAAYVPAIPNCFTQARTQEEAVERAADAAAALLASFAAHGEEIPVEAPGATIHTIDVEAPVGAPV